MALQVRSVEGRCSFDMKQKRRDQQMQGFHTLLENSNVVKILHDCRQAAASLLYQKSIRIINVFDTQVLSLLLAYGTASCPQSCYRPSINALSEVFVRKLAALPGPIQHCHRAAS